MPPPQSKQDLVKIQPWAYPQLTQTAPPHHRLRRAGDAGGLQLLRLLAKGGSQRGQAQGTAPTAPTGTLQVPEPLPVGPPWMDGQTDEENLLSLQREHKKLVFNIPVANAQLLLLLLLTQGHQSILQTLIKSWKTVVPLSIREIQGVLCLLPALLHFCTGLSCNVLSSPRDRPHLLEDRCVH